MEDEHLKYCPRCRHKLTKKTKTYLLCESCRFDFFLNPKPTANVILVNDRGQVLLTKRNKSPKKGMLALPGGFIEIGENAESSLIREVKEELGIKTGKLKYFTSHIGEYILRGIKYFNLQLYFIAEYKNQIIKLNKEISDYFFVNPRKIQWKDIGFEADKKALKDYLRNV